MTDTNRADALLNAQSARYPKSEARDLVKALYQETFGCGHLLTDEAGCLRYLLDEARGCAEGPAAPLCETLGDAFSRIHLRALPGSGLSINTLFRLFWLSGQSRAGRAEDFLAALSRLETRVREGSLPQDTDAALAFLDAYRASGCPATHHSQAFRDAYAPAYRVVRRRYADALPALCRIDSLLAEKGEALVAVEGRCAAGKTSLAALLKAVYGASVVHMDDFFLRPAQRTPERLKEIGGNVDYERFRDEALLPLVRNETFSFRPFDCHAMDYAAPVTVPKAKLRVVEGSYSAHPALADAYDLAVFADVDPARQAERILRRNGPEMQKRFLREWIPMEERYFDATGARERCGATVRMEGNCDEP